MQPLLRLIAFIALFSLGIGLTGPASSVVAQDGPEGETYDLMFRWSNITWGGPDGISPEEALTGTGAGEGGDNVLDVVTAVYGHDGEDWLSFFPAGVGLPGVNTLEALEYGNGYWVAINDPAGASWTVAPVVFTEIRIGALLSLTGGWADLGATSNAALQVAVAEWNAALEAEGSLVRIVLDVEDTQLDPDLAMDAFNDLVARGAQIIVGPQSSAEFGAIAPLASAANVVVVSQGSTSSAFAGISPNMFRFVPTDVAEGEAITDLMISEGAEAVVLGWRNDAGNEGLAESVRSFGTAAELSVSDGVTYEPDTVDYTDFLAALSDDVDAAVAEFGAENVVVYLAGFEEVADVLAAAAEVDVLGDVRWYGGDGSARASQLINVPGSADFAIAVGGYPNPLIGLPDGFEDAHGALLAEIAAIAGFTPDAFGLAAYDAANALITAALAVQNGEDDLRDAFISIADGYEGVTGTIFLNEDGDRATSPFEFWSVCDDGEGGAEWRRTGAWEPGAGPGDPGTIIAGTCEAPLS